MLDNPVLDVAIGLIFVFLLYSLLATTLKELLATIFSYRSRMLEIAIERMLDGDKKSYYWWDKLINIFLWSLHLTGFWTKKLFNKYTAHKKMRAGKKMIDAGKRTTVTEEIVTVIDGSTVITDKTTTITDGVITVTEDTESVTDGINTITDEITTVVYHDLTSTEQRKVSADENMVPIKTFLKNQPLPKKRLVRRKLNYKSDFFANKFTNHPLYLRAGEDTWFNKKPAYLTAATFSDILIDLLSPNAGRPVLLKEIANKIDKMPEDGQHGMCGGTKIILTIYLNQANGDLQRFKLLIEDWYNDTMDRVSGWYKRQAYKILFVIGLILAASFNVDTIQIVSKLSNDKEARAALVKNASAYVAEKTKPTPTPSATPAAKPGDKPKPGASATNPSKKIDSAITAMKSLYNNNIAEQNTELGLGWKTQMHLDSAQWLKARKLKNTNLGFPAYFTWYVLPLNIIGFLMTALAISLGAPFWFDLLNKFVNLRVSGKKPDDTSVAGKTAALNQKPLPNAFG